jgi:hypothetical protein
LQWPGDGSHQQNRKTSKQQSTQCERMSDYEELETLD